MAARSDNPGFLKSSRVIFFCSKCFDFKTKNWTENFSLTTQSKDTKVSARTDCLANQTKPKVGKGKWV